MLKTFSLFFFMTFPVLGFCQEQGMDITQEDERTLHELESQRVAESLNAPALSDEKVQAILQDAINKSELSQQSPEVIRALLMEKMKGTPLEKLAGFFPGLVDIFVDVLRDKKAMLGLVQIVSRKDDLRRLSFICLAIMVFGFLIKKFAVSKKAGFWKRVSISVGLTISLTLLSVGIFSRMFYEELEPTFQIIKSHL